MLLHENTNMNMSGSSKLNDDNVVANINGNYGGNNELYIHITIPNYQQALDNLTELNADIAQFIASMLENVIDLND